MFQFTERTPQPLQYYLHDDPDAFRMELGGSLTQTGAENAYQAWRTARSILGGRSVIVDITFLDQVDDAGREVLLRWHKQGARIIARSLESRALTAGIASVPAPLPASNGSWRERLTSMLVRARDARKQAKLRNHVRTREGHGCSDP